MMSNFILLKTKWPDLRDAASKAEALAYHVARAACFPARHGLEIPFPPIELQREFAHRVHTVEKLKAARRASLVELDALFASLQHRAFRG